MKFTLDKVLSRDSHHIVNLELCQVRLIDNTNYPWIILVPQKNNIIEITDFNQKDFDLFNREVRKVAEFMQHEFSPDKLNIAAIGNVVSQFHMHIIARYKNDKLFPQVVWGHEFVRYDQEALKSVIKSLQEKIIL